MNGKKVRNALKLPKEGMNKMETIAYIYNDFADKFGIPRQSGIASEMVSRIVFEPKYRVSEALRGIEDFSHLWLIWEFSEAVRRGKTKPGEAGEEEPSWKPTVRPPRLGGNTRLGVFATRSPFRPNPVGLSCVEFAGLEESDDEGTVLLVRGADLMNGTPIYDIKPYIPYADCHPEAKGGFTETIERRRVKVNIPDELAQRIANGKHHKRLEALEQILAEDPRPAYQVDSERIYTFSFGGFEVSFKCDGEVLTVTDIR